jgi:hypothetical protein
VLLACALVVPGGAVAAAGDPAWRARPLPRLAAAPDDALTRALETGRLSPARYALERWASIVDPRSVRFGPIGRPDPRAGTLYARDLLVRIPQLGPRAAARAAALLARPTAGPNDPDTPPGTDVGYGVDEETPVCGPEVCVHYVTSTANRVPPADVGGDMGVPDQVEIVADVMDDVGAFEVDGYGYRAPKGDGQSSNDGGGAELDVYLTNLGDDGLYGYCTSDDPRLFGGYRYFDFSAYCVLDNDYATAEFGYVDTTLPLRVTAAHEFFHAVQFAYDLFEDDWLMEGTATWMEDEVYDTIDDNRQYLNASPLAQPTVPLDRSAGFHVYGDWIFFRYLSESLGAGATDQPSIVRKIWAKADGSPGAPDLFSGTAVANVLDNAKKGGAPWSFEKAFREFGAWNVTPGARYREGDHYDAAPAQTTKLVRGGGTPFTTKGNVDHLSHRLLRLRRGAGVHADARLRFTVNGPAAVTSPLAGLVVVKDGGGVTFRPVTLGAGSGGQTVGFGPSVRHVVVVLGNASVRYDGCYQLATPFACNGGHPVDENERFAVTVRLLN